MASRELLAKGEVKDPRISLQAAEGQRRSSTTGYVFAPTEHAPPGHAHTLTPAATGSSPRRSWWRNPPGNPERSRLEITTPGSSDF